MYGAGAWARHRRAPSCQLGRVRHGHICVPATLGVLAAPKGLMLSLDATAALDDAATAIGEPGW